MSLLVMQLLLLLQYLCLVLLNFSVYCSIILPSVKICSFALSFWWFLIQYLAVSHLVFGSFSLSYFAICHSVFDSFSISCWQFLIQFLSFSHSLFGSFSLIFWLFLSYFFLQFLIQFLAVSHSVFGSFSHSLWIIVVTVGDCNSITIVTAVTIVSYGKFICILQPYFAIKKFMHFCIQFLAVSHSVFGSFSLRF